MDQEKEDKDEEMNKALGSETDEEMSDVIDDQTEHQPFEPFRLQPYYDQGSHRPSKPPHLWP